MDVTCYAVRGKPKSEKLCQAFAEGVRVGGGQAQVCYEPVTELLPGAAAFYGVRPHQAQLLVQAKDERRDWYYIDNAYFDATRERYFRITKNRLQHDGRGISDCERFTQLSIPILPWRRSGEHVLVCPQSDEFANLFFAEGAEWTGNTVQRLQSLTKRAVRVRPWQPNKIEWYRTLPQDLDNCWALVTHSSASAITAMLAGVPAFVLGTDCISRVVAERNLEHIDVPRYHEDLWPWCCVVADNQFNVTEIAAGYAWQRLHR